jgi:hypothetical protein
MATTAQCRTRRASLWRDLLLVMPAPFAPVGLAFLHKTICCYFTLEIVFGETR